MLGLTSQTYPPEPTSAVVLVNLKLSGTLAFHRLEVNMPDINVTTCLSSLSIVTLLSDIDIKMCSTINGDQTSSVRKCHHISRLLY
jgi:hypothetical protein